MNIDGKAESVKRVPRHIHRLAVREARAHDPMRWIRQIQSWRLDEWRTRRTARRPKGTSTMSGQGEDSIEKEDLRGCTKFYKFSNEHLVTDEREPTVIYGIGTS